MGKILRLWEILLPYAIAVVFTNAGNYEYSA